MSGVIEALVALSLKGAAVAALVGLVQLAVGERLPASLRHLLWLLVFVRLLVPVAPASPLSLLALGPGEAVGWLPGLDLRLAASGGGDAAAEAVVRAAESGAPVSPLAAGLALLWSLGFAAVVGRTLVAEARLRRHLRRRPDLDDPRVRDLLDRACRAAGVRRRMRVVETPRVVSPALHGLFRPRVLLPSGFAAADDRALGHVLLHEAMHLKRLDLPLRTLALLAAAVHWFNPAAWLALRRLDAECELACDAAALARLAEGDRREYGRTLLRAASRAPGRAEPASFATLPLSTHRNLRRRILMIARFHPVSRRRLALLSLPLAVLAMIALTDAPASAAPAAAGDDHTELKQTMQTLRDVGSAMFFHLTEGPGEAPRPAESDDPTRVDWSRCPRVEAAAVEAILVPERLPELPKTDGWGHPLELCLDDSASPAGHLVGVRSPGRDGEYEGDVYVGGSFPPDEVDRDVVWIDGMFVRWGAKPEKGN